MVDRSSLSPIRALRGSFSRKLAVLFLGVLLLIAAVGGVIYVQTGSALEADTRDEMEQSAVLQANTVGEWVDRTEEQTRYISASDRVADGNTADVEDYLTTEHRNSAPSVVAIHYYDTANDRVIASTEAGATNVSYRSADVELVPAGFAFDSQSQTRVTNPYHDPTTETDSIAFVSPVPDESDRAIVLIADLEVQVDQLERPAASNESFTHIVDDRGTVVMSHTTADINTQNMGEPDEYVVESEAVDRGLDGAVGYTDMDGGHGHGEMAMGFAPVPGVDWVIMTHIPTDAAYALHDDITRSVVALVVLSVLGLGAVGVVIGRNTTRPITELARRASELEDGNLDAELETDRTDEIGQLYAAFDSMRVSLRERIEEVEEARNRTERINRHLEAKADEYADVMQACGEGDLTRRMDPESRNEAMSEIAVEFNRMMAEIEATLDRVSRFADEVAASSEEVTASTEEVQSASAQVTESIQEISDGAERQNEQLQAVDEEMSELSTTTEEIAASSNTVADLAQKTAQTGREGREIAREAIDGMNEIEAESEQTVDAIDALESQVSQIDDLAEFITEVAEQTNMLALNANIEASRSVDSDEGFSAVAEQVKDLAEETREAAKDIEEQIESIKAKTDRTTDEVRRTSERIASHRQAVEDAVESLEEIAEYANETSDGVQEISAATEQQAATTQEVVSMVDQAASIAKETTAEAETVAAAGEEQTTSLTEVSRSVSDLSQQATELSSKLDAFETEIDPEQRETADGDAILAADDDSDAVYSFDESDDPDDASPESDDRDEDLEDAASDGTAR